MYVVNRVRIVWVGRVRGPGPVYIESRVIK